MNIIFCMIQPEAPLGYKYIEKQPTQYASASDKA